MELAGLRNHLVNGRVGTVPENFNKNTVLSEELCRDLPHLTVCLLGNFKGETGTNHHLIALANETSFGLRPCWWIEKLVAVCESEGRRFGPAFATLEGRLALLVDYDARFR